MNFRLFSICIISLVFFRTVYLSDLPKKSSTSNGKVRFRKDDEMCETQVGLLVADYHRKEDWAMRIYDSWGKSQSGLLSGNLINFGHYEQCLSTQHVFENRNQGVFLGQHCLIFFNETVTANGSVDDLNLNGNFTIDMILSQVINIKLIKEYTTRYRTRLGSAVCLPSFCTADKVREIADTMLAQYGMKTLGDYEQDDFCNVINILEIRSIDLLAM